MHIMVYIWARATPKSKSKIEINFHFELICGGNKCLLNALFDSQHNGFWIIQKWNLQKLEWEGQIDGVKCSGFNLPFPRSQWHNWFDWLIGQLLFTGFTWKKSVKKRKVMLTLFHSKLFGLWLCTARLWNSNIEKNGREKSKQMQKTCPRPFKIIL